jgi:cytochrome P450
MTTTPLIPAPVEGVETWDIDPYSNEVLGDLEPWFAGLRERGRVVWLSRYGCWALGNYDDVRIVFSDAQRFCSSRGVGLSDFKKERPWRQPSIVLEADPPEHSRARRAIMRALSIPVVEGLTDTFKAHAERLVNTLIERDSFDAACDCAEVFPLKVFPDAVGLAPGDREKLLIYGRMVFNALGPDNALRRESLACASDVVPWITARCDRAALVGPGFGETIYQAADDGDITHEEAHLLVRSLLSAGIDTTVAGIGAMLRFFAENPAQWARLRRQPELVRNAFEETLRLASPVHAFFRTAAVATEVAGIPIGEGDKVMCVLGAANTDPAKWSDPHSFDITRKLTGHVAFGAGIHACVGQHVARKEAEVLLGTLCEKVERIESLGPARWRPGNALRTLESAPMRLIS